MTIDGNTHAACPTHDGQWFHKSTGACSCGSSHSLLDRDVLLSDPWRQTEPAPEPEPESPTFQELADLEDVPQEMVDADPKMYAKRSAIMGAVVLVDYGERIGFDTDDSLLSDLLADLMHAAEAADISFDGALFNARRRHEEEAA
jgi:hypothetical protein